MAGRSVQTDLEARRGGVRGWRRVLRSARETATEKHGRARPACGLTADFTPRAIPPPRGVWAGQSGTRPLKIRPASEETLEARGDVLIQFF